MVAFFRQVIVVFLVLLQYLSPLVHAHTGEDRAYGLHLYEFETLTLSSGKVSATAIDIKPDSENCVVNVGSAIKPFANHHHFAKILFTSFDQGLTGNYYPHSINATVHFDNFISTVILDSHSCRAPPNSIIHL